MDLVDAMWTLSVIADEGSFARAARRLRRSAPTVTRTVAALEEHLGTRLFDRTTRSVHLTGAGARYLEHCRRILAAIDEAHQAAQAERDEPLGTLRVTAPVLFGRLHVAPLVAELTRRYPSLKVELELLDRVANLVEEGFDLAVRIGLLPDSSLVAAKVGSTRRVVVASPGYLGAQGRPSDPGDLARHRVIGFGGLTTAQRWRFESGRRPVDLDLAPQFVCNDAAASIRLAEEGAGLVMCLGYQVAAAVADGTLEVVLADFEPEPLPIHVVHPSSRLVSANVRALLGLIRETTRWQFVDLQRARRRRARPT